MRLPRLFALLLAVCLPAGLAQAQGVQLLLINASPGTVAPGQPVTLSVQAFPQTASGTAFVFLGSRNPLTPFATIGFSNGSGSATIGPLPAGSYTFTAQVANGGINSANTASVTVATTSALSSLEGSYAFLFQGYNSAGSGSAAIGSLTFDGAGHVSGTAQYILSPSASNRQTAVSGTYTLENDGRGNLNLGISGIGRESFRLTAPLDQLPTGVTSATAIAAGGGIYGTLLLAKQNAASFTTASVAGQYAVDLHGLLATQTGEQQVAATGNVILTGNPESDSTTTLDYTVGNTSTPGVLTDYGNPSSIEGSSGFFTVNFADLGSAGPGIYTYSQLLFVVIDASHLFLMEVYPSSYANEGPYETLSGVATR